MFVECFVDGAARGQGVDGDRRGDGACGVKIFANKKLVAQYARGLGRRTNNECEYEAVLLALVMCWSAGLVDPTVYSDSVLVVNQISGAWDCRAEALLPLLYSVREIQAEFRFRILHVPRHAVDGADALVNEFLDNLTLAAGRIPRPRKKKARSP